MYRERPVAPIASFHLLEAPFSESTSRSHRPLADTSPLHSDRILPLQNLRQQRFELAHGTSTSVTSRPVENRAFQRSCRPHTARRDFARTRGRAFRLCFEERVQEGRPGRESCLERKIGSRAEGGTIEGTAPVDKLDPAMDVREAASGLTVQARAGWSSARSLSIPSDRGSRKRA